MSAEDAIARLRALCGGQRDGALLRVALANALVADDDKVEAIAELRRAVEFDPDYSAAWKQLGKILAESGDAAAAIDAYQHGIVAAQKRGDKQAEKEMAVFLKRLQKA
ncbi:MAG TPA: tetratricopeptide repeat protein [Rudaea sp.]|jgi:predicted Zn-dependent protease